MYEYEGVVFFELPQKKKKKKTPEKHLIPLLHSYICLCVYMRIYACPGVLFTIQFSLQCTLHYLYWM